MTRQFTIRALDDYPEMKKAVEFQRVIWGSDFTELVPAVVFWSASRTGGIIAGAFNQDNDMVGLLFGMTGWDGERPIHWSDMLGVHPSERGRGLGLSLKHFQRERLLENGVTVVNWTFDPLEARNAHINFARLGVTAHEYIRDCYGVSRSPLHRGIGTDRLVAHWVLDSERVRQRMDREAHRGSPDTGAARGDALPVINPDGESLRLDLDEPRVWLRIPADIQELKSRDEVAARRWRDSTRAAFEAYFSRGYEVTDLQRGDDESRYVLEKSGGSGVV